MLEPAEARALLDGIDVSAPVGLRDRALIGLMVYGIARVGATLGMRVEDVFVQRWRLWIRLHEKGGKRREMPCHHSLEAYLAEYLDGTGLRDDPAGPLFRTIGRGTGRLTAMPLPQANAHAMIRRRAKAAGIETMVGNHSFRATGITEARQALDAWRKIDGFETATTGGKQKDKGQRLRDVANALYHYFSLTAHSDEYQEDWTRADAVLALSSLCALLATRNP